MKHPALVYLVGAGPGDSELLTVKALRLLQTADTVIYDRLVSKDIIGLIPQGVCKLYVGKATGNHALDQSEINQLLAQLARKNRKIVRLKGGDPFIFGRGGEEALFLKKQGIPFEIVPGITAAQACSAYSGIPLTHRSVARSVQYLTGHWENNADIQVDSNTLADPKQTLVIYMGLANLSHIITKIIDAGRLPETPVAIIEKGTTAQHRQVTCSLITCVKTVQDQEIQPPSLIIIGDVVTFSHQLNWFKPDTQKQESNHYAQGH